MCGCAEFHLRESFLLFQTSKQAKENLEKNHQFGQTSFSSEGNILPKWTKEFKRIIFYEVKERREETEKWSVEHVSVLSVFWQNSHHCVADPSSCYLPACGVKAQQRLYTQQEMAFQLEEVSPSSHELGHHLMKSQIDFLATAESFKDERGKCKHENPL